MGCRVARARHASSLPHRVSTRRRRAGALRSWGAGGWVLCAGTQGFGSCSLDRPAPGLGQGRDEQARSQTTRPTRPSAVSRASRAGAARRSAACPHGRSKARLRPRPSQAATALVPWPRPGSARARASAAPPGARRPVMGPQRGAVEGGVLQRGAADVADMGQGALPHPRLRPADGPPRRSPPRSEALGKRSPLRAAAPPPDDAFHLRAFGAQSARPVQGRPQGRPPIVSTLGHGRASQRPAGRVPHRP